MPACSDELYFCVPAVMCHVGGQRLLSKIIFTVCQPALMNCVSLSLQYYFTYTGQRLLSKIILLIHTDYYHHNDTQNAEAELNLVISLAI